MNRREFFRLSLGAIAAAKLKIASTLTPMDAADILEQSVKYAARLDQIALNKYVDESDRTMRRALKTMATVRLPEVAMPSFSGDADVLNGATERVGGYMLQWIKENGG